MQRISILGATGSIGQSTLNVAALHRESIEIYALGAGSNVDALYQLCCQWQPHYAAMANIDAAHQLEQQLKAIGSRTQVLAGESGMAEIASLPEVDSVMAAIVGAAGLVPTMAAVNAGKRVLLANKEALVMSGELFIRAAEKSGAQIVPVDSEHNAIFQCLPVQAQQQIGACDLDAAGISHILLTGSGGPFRQRPLETFAAITPAEAIAHPNWSMGPKISVDSATMMNKGLEYIEARWLFNTRPEQLKVVIHPQSVIHSMVQYQDGSVLAQLGQPSMQTPIAYALSYPHRMASGVAPLDFTQVGTLSFEAPDFARYPCLSLAIEACHQGQVATTTLNAANEEAVAAFLSGRIDFDQIAAVNAQVLTTLPQASADDLESLMAVDTMARTLAQVEIGKRLR
ncbi:1-deoxy-D-xylulose 5-phosphate reductoisomerase [Vibrio stylophorae]|uniref:1-deoxy-D-xylulose 5-phosphate reductoisomerase n=1 Tax=Vibrio stylophorae TaxID=659351 RepID=A0ABM8ZV99_9VIBR|nr:1-deoxy-D-xylulose-5-phosphate reductoisomerase [Vibrio stylophorae]CAH0534230.1 1-deoxy-D-xylulose 5-phosphate reductoisomerase [Vibrio stylophorae]